MAMPATLIAYFATVFLVPSRASQGLAPSFDPGFRQALRSDPVQTLSDVRRKYKGLDSRLARLERYVTSPRFNLDQEFRQL
jgi:phage shock protein C